MTLFGCLGAGLLGAVSWSFAEYGLHNWNGHLAKGRNEMSREHLAHHTDTSYFTATKKKVLAAGAVACVVVPTAIWVAGLLGAVWAVGFYATYTWYEVLHRRIHTHPPRGPYGRWARRHHLHHHFTSPKKNHGVTSPLWDWVFGTVERKPGRVRVPPKHPVSWLMEPGTHKVDARYDADYEIAKPRVLPGAG